MADLLIHPTTQMLLAAYMVQPAHAVLLEGDKGVGLATIARYIATSISEYEQTVTFIGPEKGLIAIDTIRSLYQSTRSIQSSKRCIIIDDADRMSVDAQNSLLKLLEEPVANIHFILTSHEAHTVLSTIRSRTQIIHVRPISRDESEKFIESTDLSKTEAAQALFLASGRPAEVWRLSNDKEYFTSQTKIVSDARTLLQSDSYGKLKALKQYADRDKAMALCTMCAVLLRYSLTKQKNFDATEAMEVVNDVLERLRANGHVRTQLMYLVTKL